MVSYIAMDPAGPYFTNVDPVVRLDRSDALFVDAIHTNAAPNRFQGNEFSLQNSQHSFESKRYEFILNFYLKNRL